MKGRQWRSRILRMLLFGLICGMSGGLILIILNAYIKTSVEERILTPAEAEKLANADCILILGAGVWGNERPSHMLEDRLEQGILLYQRGISDRILMSGDHGRKEYDEVNVMKNYAMEAGVPSSDIFMDHAGFSTYESVYRSRDVFQVKKVVIVTQQYHLYRALYDARRLGLDAYGVPSDQRSYAGQNYRELRELLARAKDYIYCLLQPEPTYLGEAIPVGGNGDVTND
ncbi:vancomycin permeability regulator SanA [Anaerotaenia torta]|uniref:SanA/YdcF family protein n=1 Tax=Anaerotaenia torta TaxID=433293 RepID=UPI003D1E3032